MAAALAAELEAAADLLGSPQPAPAEQPPPAAQPEPEPAYEPSNGEIDSYKRMGIVSVYHMLKCPPESEWGKHGGTLRQIADHLDMPPDCDYPMVDINDWRDSLQYILSHPGSLDKPWATLGARSQYFSHLSSLVWGGACSPQFVIFSTVFRYSPFIIGRDFVHLKPPLQARHNGHARSRRACRESSLGLCVYSDNAGSTRRARRPFRCTCPSPADSQPTT